MTDQARKNARPGSTRGARVRDWKQTFGAARSEPRWVREPCSGVGVDATLVQYTGVLRLRRLSSLGGSETDGGIPLTSDVIRVDRHEAMRSQAIVLRTVTCRQFLFFILSLSKKKVIDSVACCSFRAQQLRKEFGVFPLLFLNSVSFRFVSRAEANSLFQFSSIVELNQKTRIQQRLSIRMPSLQNKLFCHQSLHCSSRNSLSFGIVSFLGISRTLCTCSCSQSFKPVSSHFRLCFVSSMRKLTGLLVTVELLQAWLRHSDPWQRESTDLKKHFKKTKKFTVCQKMKKSSNYIHYMEL